jgi:YD repeat-containing protein
VPAEQMLVQHHYDDEGNLASVIRSVEPVAAGVDVMQSSYQYDRAHRKTHETHYHRAERYDYDPAGNVIALTTRLGQVITMQYDVLNRQVRRVVPETFHPWVACSGISPRNSPCITGLHFDSLRIAPDVQTFAYDAMGRMTAAHNRYARVKRTYFRGGALRTDTLRLRRYNAPYLPNVPGSGPPPGGPTCPGHPGCVGPDALPDGTWDPVSAMALPGDPYPNAEFTQHIYGIAYDYDRNGRRTSLQYPSGLSPTGVHVARFFYHAWGPLQHVDGLMGERYSFAYDASGRLQSISYPNARLEEYAYDADSRRVRRRLGVLFNDTLTYDSRGKIRTVAARGQHSGIGEYWYSGLGHLVA